MYFFIMLAEINTKLKVLSYWNFNNNQMYKLLLDGQLKVLSYWNLNTSRVISISFATFSLKYYHIGI